MSSHARWLVACLGCSSLSLACSDDTVSSPNSGLDSETGETGDGDGDGDGDSTGDGDGDGDGDPVCGNGVVEADEECDDGNDVFDDGCTNDCSLPVCGDGIVQAGEACDAGADNGPNSACLDSCEVNVCGDGFVGPGETCDDGNDVDDDACSNACAPVTCGDGVVDAQNGEQCDDGNDDNGDACLDTCAIATCGDGELQLEDARGQPLPADQQEQCDDGAQNSDTGACTSTCKPAVCGDGLIHAGVEACDNGPNNGPEGACLADCALNVCGDGFLGPDESCDDGNVDDGDGCSSSCALEGCGDGVTQPNEECDDGQNGDNDDGCTDACKLEACGDGFVQDGEECDDGNANANSGDCTMACTLASCGDGFVWANHEECDNGPANADDAECTSQCVDAVCGDGLVGPGEGCDDGNNVGGDGCGATCISEQCGNAIVDPGEECDDGNDVDDDECTNACTIPIPCDGPYVSKDTCMPGDQCGTVARPWCTITAALNNSISSPIRVAAAGTPYYESVSMLSNYDVWGGYEPSFANPRNPDPATNGTTILHVSKAVEWLGAVSNATLDGFRVQTEGPWDGDPIPAVGHVVRVSGSADATLRNVIVEPLNVDTYGTRAYGVYVGSGTGGNLLIDGMTSITGPRGSSYSAGVGVDATAAPASIAINDASVSGGPASRSYGVEHLGLGLLQASGAELLAGVGTTASAGILSGRPGCPGTELSQTVVHGGVSKAATGVDQREADHLTITGGTITGGGAENSATLSFGVLTEAVDTITIDGATIVGSDVGGATATTRAAAVELRNTNLAALTGATISNSTLDGGTRAYVRGGLRIQGVPVTLTTSTVRGTTDPSGTGVGIEVVDSFPANTPLSFDANLEILGGPIGGTGIYVTAVQPISVTDNALIAGCSSPGGAATGIYLYGAGPGSVITGNDQILGGPGNGSLGAHHGVRIEFADAVVSNNTLISGNADLDNPIRMDTYGILLRYGQLIAENNELILGGYSFSPSIGQSEALGIYAWSPNPDELSDITLRDNTIIAGTSNSRSYGVLFERYVAATMERNVVHVCPFDGTDPACEGGNAAFATTGNVGSLYANNYFFGGYAAGSYACIIGCANDLSCYSSDPGLLTFAHNLCLLESGQAALYIDNFWNPDGQRPEIVNNILQVDGWPGVGLFYDLNWNALKQFELRHNDIITGGDCLVEQNGVMVCATTAAEINALDGNGYLFASDNVSLDPAFASAMPFNPDPAGYHLDGSCALEDLGEVSALVSEDYDGDLRDNGAGGLLPEIGPDECP